MTTATLSRKRCGSLASGTPPRRAPRAERAVGSSARSRSAHAGRAGRGSRSRIPRGPGSARRCRAQTRTPRAVRRAARSPRRSRARSRRRSPAERPRSTSSAAARLRTQSAAPRRRAERAERGQLFWEDRGDHRDGQGGGQNSPAQMHRWARRCAPLGGTLPRPCASSSSGATATSAGRPRCGFGRWARGLRRRQPRAGAGTSGTEPIP